MAGDVYRDWLDRLADGIEAADAKSVAELFSPDVTYFDSPFDAPCRGRAELSAFLGKSLSEREDVRFHADMIRTDDQSLWAFWSNTFTRKGTDDPVRMEGVLHAEFDSNGLCSRFRQWWHQLEPGQGDLMRDFDA